MPIAINGAGTITGISAGGLPDSCITTDDIAANAVTAAKLGADQASGLAKAWVNFNGSGTVAIRASFNVSSITDNGVGEYTVNFTTAMVDVNYVVNIGAVYVTANGWFHFYQSKTSGSIRFGFITSAGSFADLSDASVAFFR